MATGRSIRVTPPSLPVERLGDASTAAACSSSSSYATAPTCLPAVLFWFVTPNVAADTSRIGGSNLAGLTTSASASGRSPGPSPGRTSACAAGRRRASAAARCSKAKGPSAQRQECGRPRIPHPIERRSPACSTRSPAPRSHADGRPRRGTRLPSTAPSAGRISMILRQKSSPDVTYLEPRVWTWRAVMRIDMKPVP